VTSPPSATPPVPLYAFPTEWDVVPELPVLPLGSVTVDDPGAAILTGPEPGMAGPDVAFPPRPPLPVVGDKHR